MNRTFDQAKKWWDERSFGQKFSIMFLTVALIAVLTYLFAVSSQPEWEVLYDDLSPADSSALATHLKDAGVLYRLTNSGKTVLVPKGVVDETRLEVAESDIIKDSVVGLEELSKIPLGVNNEQQAMWKQRIQQGELARTITTIKGVKNAKVNIAEPERSIFVSQDEKPTASVMLTLEPGIKVSQEQVKAIKNLVSHSIARLIPENVFVSDQFGKALSDDVSESGSTIDDLQNDNESKLQKKISDVLKPLVGEGNVTVRVTADMNFDRTTSKIERYIPTTQSVDGNASGVLVSEQTSGEKYTGQDGKAPGGVPGTTTNINNPSYAASTGAAGNKSSDYNKNAITKNYEVSKETKDIVYAPGDIERMSIAVSINKLLTSKEQTIIENLVKNAAGFDDARGDTVTIAGLAFAGTEEAEAKQAELEKENAIISYLSLAKEFLPYLLILVFGGLTMGIFWSFLKRPVEAEEYTEPEEPAFDFPDAPDLLEAASIPIIEAKLDPEIERMRSEINSFVMNDPAEAARLLMTFIKE